MSFHMDLIPSMLVSRCSWFWVRLKGHTYSGGPDGSFEGGKSLSGDRRPSTWMDGLGQGYVLNAVGDFQHVAAT